MRLAKLVPFGMALVLVLQGCSSTASDSGVQCSPPCGPNSSCDLATLTCVCFDGGYAQCGTTDAGLPICSNTLSDNNNCGVCGNACPGAPIVSSCLSGLCSCLQQSCPGADGGIICTNTSTDSNNCGGCTYADAGVICPFGEICQNSICACAPGFTSCSILNSDGTMDGGSYCADTTVDKLNCGTCGTACGNNQKCTPQGSMGVCVCDTTAPDGGDLIQCPSGCVHSNGDSHNCGGCGIQCETGICNNGVCLCNPDAGILQCTPTRCADTNSDKKNCGACGNDCTQGGILTFPNIVCKSGQCRCQGGQDYICPQPVTPFPTLACIDVSMDPNNCGGCGLVADGGGPLSDGGLPPSPYICSGVKSACQNGSCNCPNNQLYCAPGTWNPDAGTTPNDGGFCLNDTSDRLNCGGCGNNCGTLYAGEAICQFASCTCIDAGICVTSVSDTDPLHPSCDCNGLPGTPNPDCSAGATVTFLKNIYPLLSNNTVTNQPSWGSGGVLVGCAVSGCHDSTAAAGLQFTDPDASYQELTSVISNQICNGVSTPVLNPSQICFCQSLVNGSPGTPGNGAASLLYTMLSGTFICPNPDGGIASNMPIDDGGTWHPLSACLAAQVRQWIDQGSNY